MNKARILAEISEVAPDVAAALTTLSAHGFEVAWREVAFFVARRVGQSLRFSEGEGGISPKIREILLTRYGSSPAVVALVEVLPKNRRWTAALLAPLVCQYFQLGGAETLRASMPPGDPPD